MGSVRDVCREEGDILCLVAALGKILRDWSESQRKSFFRILKSIQKVDICHEDLRKYGFKIS